GRWLTPDESPFHTASKSKRGVEPAPGFSLTLASGGPEASVYLDPVEYQPRSVEVDLRTGPLHIDLDDWRTRRGFAWPHQIQIGADGKTPTILTTSEIRFEPSAATVHANETKRTRLANVSFVGEDPHPVRVRRSASGHMLVRPKLMGQEPGWFLVDTGTGVNCLDTAVANSLPGFLPEKANSGREISVVGLGGSVQSRIVKGGEFALGAMRTKGMEWVALDLAELQEVVGVKLAGVLGGDFFERAVVEIDLLNGTLVLHESQSFDASRLPWRPLRFDGTTPCVRARFAPKHEGWFRLDTGSDDTVTFHSPWVRKLRMVDKATQLIPMRLKGIGGEIRAVRGRIKWFELMGQRFTKPKVTMVERATGPLANPDLYGNIGVGFFVGQRLILDYPGHRVALIPR
ncbi:MAG: aspartyl protease family protein, partial [Planctomycetota bacterium]|nr:aspartyl protease family protein [Planctomycetota bacterium]